MTRKTGPVIVKLNCEAHPATHTIEYDRDEWNAMTPTGRAVMLDSEVATHIANSGGGGWYIADEEDEASVGSTPIMVPLPLADNQAAIEAVGKWLANPNRPNGPVYYSAKDLLARLDAVLAGKEA